MSQDNITTLNKLYDSLKLLCYQVPHFMSDFDNEFPKKSENDKLIFNQVQKRLKTCMDDLFAATDLVYTIINSDDEGNLESLIGSTDGVEWKDG